MEQKVEGSRCLRITADTKRQGRETLGMEKLLIFLNNPQIFQLVSK